MDNFLEAITSRGIIASRSVHDLSKVWYQLVSTEPLEVSPYRALILALDRDCAGFLVDLNKVWMARN